MAAWIGLAGVAVGAALTAGMDWLRRRWARADTQHGRVIDRGEELLQRCAELLQWSEDSAKAAFRSDDVYIPIQHAIYRIAVIVDVYFVELRPQLEALDKATSALRGVLVDIITNRHAGLPMTSDVRLSLKNANSAFVRCVATFTTDARKLLRTRLES